MKNEKKDNSNVLMVVGCIFILLAGGICVIKAWDYLPLAAKQACLFGVAMFGLGSSFVLFSKDRLHKTESALFYIGNAFLGYFFLSVMDSVYSEDVFGIWEKSFVISLVLFITVAIKLAVKKSVVEYIAGAVLLNWMVFSGYSLLELGKAVCACMIVSVGFVVCGISYVMKNSFRETKIAGEVIKVALLVQEIVVIYYLMFSGLLWSETESIADKVCSASALCGGIALCVCICMYLKDEGLQSAQFWLDFVLILILVCYNLVESDLIITISSSVT